MTTPSRSAFEAARAAPEPYLCLFNTEAYHRGNMEADQKFVRLDHFEDGRLVGVLAGVLAGETLDCGWHAPFGGLDVAEEGELAGRVVGVVRGVLAGAREAGARRIRIRCRPDYAGPLEPVIQFALLSQGFAVESAELSLGVALETGASADDYLARLSRKRRRELRQGLARELIWSRARSDAEWTEAWEVFVATKARLGVAMRFGLEQMRGLDRLFPGRIRVGLLREGATTVAAAAVYRVLPEVDYLAVWGQTDHGLADSPMTVVAYHIVEDALREGAGVIDFGLASSDQTPDDGLIQFKRKIGCAPALRLDLVRELDG
jgi:hypothetical protein